MSRTSADFSSDTTILPLPTDLSPHMIPSDRPRKRFSRPLSTQLNRMGSSIRTVRSFDAQEQQPRLSEDSATTEWTMQSPSQSAWRDSAFSSSITSSASYSSLASHSRLPQQPGWTPPNGPMDDPQSSLSARLKQGTCTSAVPIPIDGPPTTDASGRRGTAGRLSTSTEPSQRESSMGGRPASAHSSRDGRAAEQPPGSSSSGAATASGTNGSNGPNGRGRDELSPASTAEAQLANGAWDSTVGKAGLGKTGRVINRLVSENEALKRDIKIERLRAEEAKQAARLLEDKMERMAADYEGRLFEASITKTMLTRKENQVESLQAVVELERRRAADAAQREETWKGELEAGRADAQRRIDEAAATAALMEGRYDAISSHWRDQGADAQRAVRRVRADVDALRAERRRDDERILTLRDLCDQQDSNIRDLTRQRDDMAARLEAYKREQDAGLAGIKAAADQRERDQTRMLAEAGEVLDKLRWALSVKENVKWAQ